jgi:hypothetical protein
VTPANGTPLNPRCLAIVCAQAHAEGFFNSHSPAFLNNNPTNLTRWPGVPNHGRYSQFRQKADGFRAAYQDVWTNRNDTLGAFLAKFAPPTENNTNAYIQAVSEFSGIAPDERIAPDAPSS